MYPLYYVKIIYRNLAAAEPLILSKIKHLKTRGCFVGTRYIL